jgi:AcrR family transcriptional regulator
MSADERRTALVHAAIAVMKRRGVANTSTRDIVAEAGMQIGVFHYCFESKEELIREVMRTINERTNTAVGDGLAGVEPGPAFMHAAVQAYWHHIQSDPNEHLLTYELTTHALRNLRGEQAQASVVGPVQGAQGEVTDAAVSQYRHYLFTTEALLMLLADVCQTQWTTPVPRLARVCLAAIEGITLQWLVDGEDDCATESLGLLADVLARDAGLV